MGAAKQVRRRPDDRRAEIVEAARGVFLRGGYDGFALAEVAAAGEVSRGSIYRYFPSGRADLFVAVLDQVVGELHERLRYAASVPFSPATRMEHVIGALFAYFQDDPDAYRALFRDVWSTGEPEIEAAGLAARALLTSEIAGVIADAELDVAELTAAASGILGFALATVDLALRGEVEAEAAWRVTCAYATSQLA
ncbi:TetR/AcrR family transcriptional regulator [Actinomarinicola tropica]|uniref:TetR family transcriptional regulator n=1 Tax=Actinomarinicola tropica TaxID=2789776 RepID=A0A5Q2RD77_9ACTN|nr:TetR/AcrR family transcriptional regulator [Actinomarinicola tropica]QGG93664.1 TetR family transcriptional regulator [Actinomarinicola tropica]